MRKNLYILLSALLLALGTTSCTDDNSLDDVFANKSTICFIINLGQNGGGSTTRATNNVQGTYNPFNESEAAYDNHINLNSLCILLYDATGNFVGRSTQSIYTPIGNGAIEFRAQAPVDQSGEYKVVVLANVNVDELPTSSLTALQTATYTLYENGSMANTYIPMWGIKAAHISVEKGFENDLKQIDVLRACSKVTMKLNSRLISEGYSIKEIKVHNYNQKGSITPLFSNSTANTTDVIGANYVNLPTDAGFTTTPLTIPVKEGTIMQTFYLPEVVNTSSPQPMSISMTLVDKKGKEYDYDRDIKFEDYDEGQPTGNRYNIVRNCQYGFSMNAQSATLFVEPKVMPWTVGSEMDYSTNVEISLTMKGMSNGEDGWDNKAWKIYSANGLWGDNWPNYRLAVAYNESMPQTFSPVMQLTTHNVTGKNIRLQSSNPYIGFRLSNDGGQTFGEYQEKVELPYGADETVTTYFVIAPKTMFNLAGSNAQDRNARISLVVYSATNTEKEPFNTIKDMPGNESHEDIWVYYVSPSEYESSAVRTVEDLHKEIE